MTDRPSSLRSNLAIYYYRGGGIEQDFAQAARWCRIAADQNVPGALHVLAMLSQYGEGVPHDAAQARRFMARAAALGNADARDAMSKGFTGDL